ncbi:MAG: DUF4331 family protein [Dokdonella sp.]|uniref:DUF4331 family protein n=1 Tax=Dokdonella sp. TaxID=2291710 RepID=UPI003F7F7DA5
MHPARLSCRAIGVLLLLGAAVVQASDHLDTPTVITDPRADIGDLYAWTSPDGRQLELVMTIVGHAFSDRLTYEFHVDSGPRFGGTTATTTIACRLATPGEMECRAGHGDWARGGNTMPDGLEDRHARFRVFAGLRDDPFFNNVKGTRAAYQAAIAAIGRGAANDEAGCPSFDATTVREIHDQWRHTEGGPAKNLLAGWTPASLVVSIDIATVAKGGRMLAIWSSTSDGKRRIDRAGRPLTGNALLGTTASDEVADRLKEAYNAASPSTARRFVAEIEKNLALYDAFDGRCGNAFLADPRAGAHRYRKLARLLADDRLWVDTTSASCTQPFAVELAALGGHAESAGDCGGRTPAYDAIDVYRSLLANGTTRGIDDGVDRDEHEHSSSVFPFLAAPENAGYPR